MLHLNTIYIRKTEFHRLRELAPGDGKRGPPAQRLTTNAKYEVRPSWATPSSSPHTSLRYFLRHQDRRKLFVSCGRDVVVGFLVFVFTLIFVV